MRKIKINTRILSILTLIFGIAFLFESCKGKKLLNPENEWINLFDGKTTDGWRVYNGEEIPKKWTVVDGNLTFDTELKLEDDFSGGGEIKNIIWNKFTPLAPWEDEQDSKVMDKIKLDKL